MKTKRLKTCSGEFSEEIVLQKKISELSYNGIPILICLWNETNRDAEGVKLAAVNRLYTKGRCRFIGICWKSQA